MVTYELHQQSRNIKLGCKHVVEVEQCVKRNSSHLLFVELKTGLNLVGPLVHIVLQALHKKREQGAETNYTPIMRREVREAL